MVSRTTAALVTALLVVVAVGYEVRDWNDPPEIAVDNADDRPYRLVAHTVSGLDSAEEVTLDVRAANGSRLRVGAGVAVVGSDYYDARLVDESATNRTIDVPAGATLSRTVAEWTHGRSTVYVLEDPADERLVAAEVVVCDRGGQDHRLRIPDDRGPTFGATCG